MKILRVVLLLSFTLTSFAATPGNDESCDISVMPAATLLLPYFEVDLDLEDDGGAGGARTAFTLTNVTNVDRIARVTLWTDRAYPVLAFNVTLTGYDVQVIDLRELLTEGRIGDATATRGKYSDPNADIDTSACASTSLDATQLARVQTALTTGAIAGECDSAGGTHDNAVGYVTVDVVGLCSNRNATDPEYWTKDIRFDNVLLGDYQHYESSARAVGGPMVHIRAVPEGGTSVQRRKSPEEFDAGFQRTFYARYQTRLSPNLDGRQPLPSRFAARFIEDSSLKIWREGRAGLNATCADYALNAELAVEEIAVFDERSNAIEPDSARVDELPVVSKLDVGADDEGWMHLDLDRTQRDGFASQAWVISSMSAGDFSVDVEATALGNGCSTRAEHPRDENSCDIALLPAATLLLPHFMVDLDDRGREATLFTITNTSPRNQIARVTLWTDYAFPVVSFNIALRGFDVQGIHLYDILKNGTILSENACGTQLNQIPEEILGRMSSAFHEGTVPECNNVGNEHDDATGYATIDVVRNCSANSPVDEAYWTEDLAWDNVLVGDYQQIHLDDQLAYGSPLVHVRAIPEGGTYRERRANPRAFDAGFPRTFYGRYQDAATPKLDGRQPLPSVFAARWSADVGSTDFVIWREGPTGREVECRDHDLNAPPVAEFVRFDDAENAAAFDLGRVNPPIPAVVSLPATLLVAATDTSIFPPRINGATSGWMYMNLDDPAMSWASSNWVVTSIRTNGFHAVAMDASALGNGCSPPAGVTEVTQGTEVIGPRP